MVCALLLDKKVCKTAEEAMMYYGEKRTQDGKVSRGSSSKCFIFHNYQYINMGRNINAGFAQKP